MLETGKPREERGQLEGRAYVQAFPESEEATKDRLKVTWTVRAPDGGDVKVTARHPRAGAVSTVLTLSASEVASQES
jgi:hypothetical protein